LAHPLESLDVILGSERRIKRKPRFAPRLSSGQFGRYKISFAVSRRLMTLQCQGPHGDRIDADIENSHDSLPAGIPGLPGGAGYQPLRYVHK